MKKLMGIFLGLIIICLCSCGTKPGRDDPSLPDEDGLELDILSLNLGAKVPMIKQHHCIQQRNLVPGLVCR